MRDYDRDSVIVHCGLTGGASEAQSVTPARHIRKSDTLPYPDLVYRDIPG